MTASAHNHPHLDEAGTCICACRECTVKETRLHWRCICGDCDERRCGLHFSVLDETEAKR